MTIARFNDMTLLLPCSRRLGGLIGFRQTVRLPDHTLDLLLTPCAQELAKTNPVEDRESSPQVRLDPVFGWVNLPSAHNAYVHRCTSCSAPACRRPGLAC